MALNLSSKRVQIDKANVNIVIAVSVAAFVLVFSLIASKSLLAQRSYQAKVIAKKEVANKQLLDNLKAADSLVSSYKQFVSTPNNVIGGNPVGQGDRDGDNAKIVLDALPSKYDFPALATSLEKILTDQNYKITGITGTDDELNQSALKQSSTPVTVEIPFSVAVSGNYASMQNLLQVFERSIRPFKIQTLSFSGKDQELNATVTALTYYQPEKTLNIRTEVVK